MWLFVLPYLRKKRKKEKYRHMARALPTPTYQSAAECSTHSARCLTRTSTSDEPFPFLWLQYYRSNGKGSGCRETLEGPTLSDSEWYWRVTQEEPPVISDQSVLFPRWVRRNRATLSDPVPLSSVQLSEESTKHVCCSPANANDCRRSVLWTETLWIPQFDASLFPSRVF